jgi:hypothetical protein
MSLTQLVGYCIIYVGGRDLNLNHPIYLSYWWNFKPLGYMDKKNSKFLIIKDGKILIKPYDHTQDVYK